VIVDALEPGFAALAAFPVGGHAGAIGRSPRGCTVLSRHAGNTPSSSIWLRASFELPSWTLRAHRPLRKAPVVFHGVAGLAATASTAAMVAHHGSSTLRLVVARDASGESHLDLDVGSELSGGPVLEANERWLALALADAAGLAVLLLDAAGLARRMMIRLEGARHVGLRFQEDTLTVSDDRGRVLVVELAYGGLARDLRV